MKTQKKYEAPQTQHAEVELEQGFMKASVFDPADNHDNGVSIEGHEYGNYGNYFDNTTSGQGDQAGWNDWDN